MQLCFVCVHKSTRSAFIRVSFSCVAIRYVSFAISYGGGRGIESCSGVSPRFVACSYFCDYPVEGRSAQWRSLLRQCAASPNVEGLIPEEVCAIFYWLKSFRLHCDPGVDSASDVRKWVLRISCGGKGGRCIRLTTWPLLCADCLWILGASTALRACLGL